MSTRAVRPVALRQPCTLMLVLGNSDEQVDEAAGEIHRQLDVMGLGDEPLRNQVHQALVEALANAVYHGNLEVTSDLRQDDLGAFLALAEERRQMSPWRDRRVHLTARLAPDELRFTIRDEGPGFDPAAVPTAPAPDQPSGRGLLLMRACMDEVTFNLAGNEVTLVKRLPR